MIYGTISLVFWFVRQFLLPNPFAILGEGITITLGGAPVLLSPVTLNWIAGVFLPALTFAIVGLYHRRGSSSVRGSILYMIFFLIHIGVLHLMAWAYPSIFFMVLIVVVYAAVHIGCAILGSEKG